jgi:acetolactate decarboxylase
LSFQILLGLKFVKLVLPLIATVYLLHLPVSKVTAQSTFDTRPVIVGAMKKVMRGGELFPKIHIDTISNKTHLYGMGPLAYLKGETIILDGVGYTAKVVNDSQMRVEKTLSFSAPFFGYTHIEKWKQLTLPDTVTDPKQLESFLAQSTIREPRPFFFKMMCRVSQAEVHLVNLPEGIMVLSPEDARKGRRNYSLHNEEAELLGFFSTTHQTIFTHHDTWLHIHLINKNRTTMGHLENISILPGTAKLYLPDIR